VEKKKLEMTADGNTFASASVRTYTYYGLLLSVSVAFCAGAPELCFSSTDF
jgi:hypothetical protein